jgi:hypothetical protein
MDADDMIVCDKRGNGSIDYCQLPGYTEQGGNPFFPNAQKIGLL